MNVRRLILITASTTMLASGAFLAGTASAHDRFPAVGVSTDLMHLFETADPQAGISPNQGVSQDSRSDVRRSQMSVSELRQARAMYRAQQRTARLEYNLWMGHEPLRPNWNSIPMMSSRYTHRRIYVPAYIRTR